MRWCRQEPVKSPAIVARHGRDRQKAHAVAGFSAERLFQWSGPPSLQDAGPTGHQDQGMCAAAAAARRGARVAASRSQVRAGDPSFVPSTRPHQRLAGRCGDRAITSRGRPQRQASDGRQHACMDARGGGRTGRRAVRKVAFALGARETARGVVLHAQDAADAERGAQDERGAAPRRPVIVKGGMRGEVALHLGGRGELQRNASNFPRIALRVALPRRVSAFRCGDAAAVGAARTRGAL
eukprot:360271-Chlamydomonas_euryale.AAC.2